MPNDTLLIGTASDPVRQLAGLLEADWLEVPSLEAADGEALERFRQGDQAEGVEGSHARVVVALWAESATPAPLIELDDDSWLRRGEFPVIAWSVAMGIASRRVADDGAVVALVEVPAPIDSGGWTPECGVGEAAIVLARSIAQSEGARGVRANAVTTPMRLGGGVLAPAPALPQRYPGTLDREIVGAVRMLLSDDARGVTAGVTHADCGRTLR